MIFSPNSQILLDSGFTDGWAISGDILILWEHEQDPPAPLTRPTDEIPIADSSADA